MSFILQLTKLNAAPDLRHGIRTFFRGTLYEQLTNFVIHIFNIPFKVMRYSSLFRYGLFLLCFSTALQAQNDKALLRELVEENKKSVEALALYPQDTRLAILEGSKYPEVLIKMNSARQKTAAAFRTLIEDFPRSTQEVFYDLVRYPGLMQQLIEKQESPAAIREALQQLPETQRGEAFGIVQNNMRTLLKINELDNTSHNAFEDLIATYTLPAQQAFRKLVELPEVLEILNEDLRFTVLIGDVYREDPAWTIHYTDSLNLAVARTHAQELEDWKKSIENDPQAQQELEAASKEYAAEYGYDSEDYSGDDLYYDDDYVRRQSVVTYYHYPWWFGYPWWYDYPYWRPYPWWYDWGFYYRRPRAIVIIYMPSWHFMHWYFYHPHHHHHYSHLSSHFVNHYYGHRRSGTTISMSVGNWRDQNRAVISDEWLKDKTRLPERMKEFGRFEEERQKYNTRNPKTPVNQEQYLEKNKKKYPGLVESKARVKEEIQREEAQKKPSEWAPRKEPAPTVPKTEPAQKPQTERPPRIQPVPPAKQEPKEKPQAPPTEKPRTEPKKERPVEEAKDYHRQKWEETKRIETQREKQPAAAPRTQPQSQPRTQPQSQPKAQPKSQPQKSEPKKEGGRKN